MKIQMLIASHKQYEMPSNDGMYTPIFVGAALSQNIPDGFQSDATGDNISSENPHYNELTATYWAWKNSEAEVIGLNHYRRYFVSRKSVKKNFKHLLNKREILTLLAKGDVVLPTKRHYYIETIESHFAHSHNPEELDILKKIFTTFSKAYQDALRDVLSSTSAHMFNMFIMHRREFDEYCSWLFPTLHTIENNLDFSKLEGNEKRALGFIAEILMDVWVIANGKKVVECPVQFLESNHWPKKIFIFLMNKFSGKKGQFNTHIN
ncbi:hypothetical protein FAM22277_01902 [Lacticaseibacillus paracasei]|uniref:DUF4422 domain-containing protein n=1 Tax=Lacticaseibacillus paracasei TaxID=1597 RepID=UPI000F0B9211|nr:DUF4422 domain-containing protein [Lacticaseibacillus paracasei]RNE02180.1 hypothetical protein FAM22277_01902 [Lacticaseibacillus paracasei]